MSKPNNKTDKLQKVLAQAGLASRREAERWIADGRVSVNGKISTVGDRVSEFDKIRVDGHVINIAKRVMTDRKILLYNKPEGQICSRDDPEHQDSVFDHLPKLGRGRWIMVGRLDINSAGLLLFTNDGELAHRLMHPSYQMERTYAVRVTGKVEDRVLKNLLQGVELEDGLAKFSSLVDAGGKGINHWYHVTLNEGRNREVRRMWQSQNIMVNRLIRIQYGPVPMPRGLRNGEHQLLPENDVEQLLKAVKLKT